MKHLKYLGYVLRHRWFVFVECVRLGVFWRGLTHDLSKFLPDEWFPYATYFYEEDFGCRDKVMCDRARRKKHFDVAWLKHQRRNPHHWEYWRAWEGEDSSLLLRMPNKYIREMLADWRGAGRAQGHPNITEWYAKNRGKIKLHPRSKEQLHALMMPEELGEA